MEKTKKKRPPVTEEKFVEALQSSSSIRQALQKLGINYAAKYYYDKAHDLIDKYHIIQKKKIPEKTKAKKKDKKKEPNHCVDCGKSIDDRAIRCMECEHKRQRCTEWPQKDDLKKMIRYNSFRAIGKQFNVSDNTIRKWCKHYELPYKRCEIKAYSDEEWLAI